MCYHGNSYVAIGWNGFQSLYMFVYEFFIHARITRSLDNYWYIFSAYFIGPYKYNDSYYYYVFICLSLFAKLD